MKTLILPQKSYFGEHALADALPEIVKMGKKALIVTGPHVGKSQMISEMTGFLDEYKIKYSIFKSITGEPTLEMIDLGYQQFILEGCDYIIGIGGGSPLDAAKAIALKLSYPNQPLSDFMGMEIDGDFVNLVAIPTTSGTGSEATKFTVITDAQNSIKMLLKSEKLIPKLAILDYRYTLSSPEKVTVATALDALTHAVEAYTSNKAFPVTDSLAIAAVQKIFKYLPVVYENPQDTNARESLMYAAYEAGICINNASVTIVHGMSRPIGALFHVPHGISNAMLLKGALAFVIDGAPERFANLALAIGLSDAGLDQLALAEKFIQALDQLAKSVGVPALKDYGLDELKFMSLIDKMSEDAILSGSPANCHKTVIKADIIQLYHSIWNNEK
ncbi:MAG: iron-containing alcohol dehydrogenase [Streptococcaceae bacterium]|jgi:alcohol dehydrogenase class IV|nr:iron-containing alcohol dehydrogenase [Streptococcaceae bacterium]